MKGVIKVVEKATNQEKIAVYAANRLGNRRWHLDGKFLTDKEFNKKYTILPSTK